MKKLLLFFLSLICLQSQAQVNDTITELFSNAYKVYQLQRSNDGMYRDSKLFNGLDFHPVSIANTGIGLISLCIADTMDWEFNAKEQALTTLKTVTGHDATFRPDRNASGYFRHFMDINTGVNAWNSEYSTIDTDILVSGALFCKNYFQDDSITKYVDELWNSIDFNAAIADPALGRIYLEMEANGSGKVGSYTLPYNEYMIVAWLAKNASDDPNTPGNQLWNNFYSTTTNLPKPGYRGINVLSDNGSAFLSSFTHQFNYYLCHYFAQNDSYMDFYRNAYKADSAWWKNNSGFNEYEWGLGAGSSNNGSGYNADKINGNGSKIVSPHIIAGFLPVNPAGKRHLLDMYRSAKGRYQLPLGAFYLILWRYSVSSPSWTANEVQGIDYSSMLFGLASLPEYLGPEFFSTYNDFFDSATSIGGELEVELKLYPNPSSQYLILELEDLQKYEFSILDLNGKRIKIPHSASLGRIEWDISALSSGMYLLEIQDGKLKTERKFLIP